MSALLTSCLKDKFQTDNLSTEVQWNPNLAAPLAFGKLQLLDMVKNVESNNFLIEFEKEPPSNDSLIKIVVRIDSIFTLKTEEFLKLPIIEPINKRESLGEIKIDNYDPGVATPITMSELVTELYSTPDQATISSYAGSDNVIASMPADPSRSMQPRAFDGRYDVLEWVEFSNGQLIINVENQFACPVQFELVILTGNDINSLAPIGSIDFTTTASGNPFYMIPGERREKPFDLNGVILRSTIGYRIENMTLGGASYPVNINLADRLLIYPSTQDVRAIRGVAMIPTQKFSMDTTTFFTVDTYEGKEIFGLDVKKGSISYALESFLQTPMEVEISFPTITKGSDTLSKITPMGIATNIQSSWNLAGYNIDLTKNPAQRFNSLPARISYGITQTTGMVAFDSANYVQARFANDDILEFYQAYGNFGQEEVVIDSDSIDSNLDKFLKDYFEGEIILADPSIILTVDNSVGVEGTLDLNLVGTGGNNQEVNLFNGTKHWDILGPSFQEGAVNYNNQLIVDSAESELVNFLAILPREIRYDGRFVMNQNKTDADTNFVTDESSVNLGMEASFPLKLKMKNVVLRTEVALPDQDESLVKNIESLELYFNIKNQFPLDLKMRLTMLDTLATNPVLDEYEIPLIHSAITTNGKVPRDEFIEYTEIISLKNEGQNTELDNFIRANKLRIEAVLDTENRGSNMVGMYTYYGIDFKFGIKTKVLIETEL